MGVFARGHFVPQMPTIGHAPPITAKNHCQMNRTSVSSLTGVNAFQGNLDEGESAALKIPVTSRLSQYSSQYSASPYLSAINRKQWRLS